MFIKSDAELVESFNKILTRKSLADLLEISDDALRYFIYGEGSYYSEFNMFKKNGTIRGISAPNKKLKNVQRKLAYVLNLVYKPKICVTGFVKNRSILDNAAKHKNKKIILNIDLKDFFDQIHFGRVRGLFLNKPYDLSPEVATVIAQLVCYDGRLPQGAPTSPIISNMVCRRLDYQLLGLSRKYGITYSRYADDLVFSSYRKAFPSEIVHVVNDEIVLGNHLLDIIKSNDFLINKRKIHLRKYTERQEVTGIIVNKFPNVKKEYIKEVRAILHNCQKNGVYKAALYSIKNGLCKDFELPFKIDSDSMNKEDKEKLVTDWLREHLKGRINFIKEIKGNSRVFQKYALIYNQVFQEKTFTIEKNIYSNSVFLVERIDGLKQGSAFILKDFGLISSYHLFEDNDFYYIYNQKSRVRNEGCFSLGLTYKKCHKDIDYVLFEYSKASENGLKVGDSNLVQVDDKVKLVGYPTSTVGSPYQVITTTVTARYDNIHGSDFVTVSNTIQHGMSGGVVLNMNEKVVGVIKGGVDSTDEEYSGKMGFVPINSILEHYKGINDNT